MHFTHSYELFVIQFCRPNRIRPTSLDVSSVTPDIAVRQHSIRQLAPCAQRTVYLCPDLILDYNVFLRLAGSYIIH